MKTTMSQVVPWSVQTLSGFAGSQFYDEEYGAEVTLIVRTNAKTVEDVRAKVETAVNCHASLLEACKGELEALEIWIRAANIPDDVFDGMQISRDKLRTAITKASQ